ncbi:MAG: hypothetical protein AAFP86_19130, partial [Planctomycetota bacterium]
DRGGRFYFAKDAVLGPGAVRRMYDPAALKRFLELKDEHDPGGLFQSDLSRRVLGEGDALVAADALRTAG